MTIRSSDSPLRRGTTRNVASPESAPASEFRALRKSRTFEEITNQVREMLFGGSLKPGDRLPAERELSQILGIGRPALREALRALEANGLIVLRMGKSGGAFISSGKPSVVSDNMSDLLRLGNVSIAELFEARVWIQSALASAACTRATDADIKALRENVVLGEMHHAAGRAAERISANIEFHNILANATHNSVAVMVIRGLTDGLRNLIRQVGSDPAPTLFKDRRALLAALEARDEKAAGKAMARLLKTTMQTYQRLAEQQASQTDVTVKVPPAKRAARKSAARKNAKSS
ncbi:MAG: FadR/GntR family transcriptional regulator [Janthinobacterium lividum]